MISKFITLTLLYLFFGVNPVFAIDPPNLTSPSNNSTVTSSKLEWQAPAYLLYSSNPYRVQVDEDPSFTPASSIYRDSYKTTTTYTPELTYGIWYWRIKAKNTDGIWSDWSTTWSFNLNESTPTSSPTPTETPTPTPDPTSSPNSDTFIISNTPTQVNSDQSITTLVNLSIPDKSNTRFYMKGAFKKFDGSNYFGLTKVSSSWIKNGSSYSSQYELTTNGSGNWSGNLDSLVDLDDSGYTGTGDYIFKIGRYDANGNGPTWSNEVTVHINNVVITQETTPSTPPSTITKTAAAPTPATIKTVNTTNSVVKLSPKIASVAGISKRATSSSSPISSPSANIKAADQNHINPFIIVGSLFVIIGISSLTFIVYKRR